MDTEFKKMVKDFGLTPEQVQRLIDWTIGIVEQESFYDPDTKEQTFYTEQLVKRLKELVK